MKKNEVVDFFELNIRVAVVFGLALISLLLVYIAFWK